MADEAQSEIETRDAEIVDQAMAALRQLDLAEVERLLQPVLANTPADYITEFEEDGKRYIKFWDLEEFLAHVAMSRGPDGTSQLIWLRNAYPRAHFCMAVVCVERQQWDEALRWLEAGMKLEPGQPRLHLEKARVLSALGRHGDALSMYEGVLDDARVFAPSLRARALRGRGFQLIELGSLDEAERCFVESLEHDPESSVARNELEYIRHLRSGGETAPEESVVTGLGANGSVCAACGADVVLDDATRGYCESCGPKDRA